MKTKFSTGILIACMLFLLFYCKSESNKRQSILFCSYAENSDQVHYLVPLVESLRTFAGKYKDAMVWIYIPLALIEQESETIRKLESLGVMVKNIEIPEEAAWFFLSGKVFATAKAEAEAEGKTQLLVFLNYDTIFLDEPGEFNLPKTKKFGYRPVMHKNVGLLYSEPLDSFWTCIYEIMSVDESNIFPMVTPADNDTIRPYFNAGLLAVRPEEKILRHWAEYYTRLYQDSILKAMCVRYVAKRIFLHQTALTGAILNHLSQDEILLLSDRINYPIFFKEQFGAQKDFHDISDVVTFRHESWFTNPEPEWDKKLSGPEEKIEWMREHLCRLSDPGKP